MCSFASLGTAFLVALNATAQTPAPSTTASSTPAPTDSATVKLPYGVEDVLKLSRAQVSEDVTLNFIHNSGTIYNLAPKDIVYLRNEGVSDRVISAMLNQRKNVPAERRKPPRPARPLRRRHLSIRTPTPLPPRRHRHNTPRITFNLNPLTFRTLPSIQFPIRPRPTLTTMVATLTTTAILITAPGSGSDLAGADMAGAGTAAAIAAVAGFTAAGLAVGGMVAAATANCALLSRRSSSLNLFGRP